jgi:NAD(P)-dependent dehydrogenase (short-subunit alcohol dehydrogenase family)
MHDVPTRKAAVVESIALEHGRIDGLVAAAKIQQTAPAAEDTAETAISILFEQMSIVFVVRPSNCLSFIRRFQ